MTLHLHIIYVRISIYYIHTHTHACTRTHARTHARTHTHRQAQAYSIKEIESFSDWQTVTGQVKVVQKFGLAKGGTPYATSHGTSLMQGCCVELYVTSQLVLPYLEDTIRRGQALSY